MSIKRHTKNQHADALARYMPDGPIFEAKFIEGSIFRGWINASSCEYVTAEGFIKLLYDEYVPQTTTELLDEWERMLGLPDDCFPASDDPDERRLYISAKLLARGAQTVEDFQTIADLFGVSANVIPGFDYAGWTFPITDTEKRFYIVVEFVNSDPGFPYTFPITFGSTTFLFLECLFRKLKPANCEVLFTEV